MSEPVNVDNSATSGEVASVGYEGAVIELGHSAPKRGRGRPRIHPDIEATPVSGKPGQLTVATIPYRVLARIRKIGPMTYSEISAFVAGSRMVRRDKYIDGAILRLEDLHRLSGDHAGAQLSKPGSAATAETRTCTGFTR